MKKISRKGSGRKKGQLTKAFDAGQPLAEILRLAERGEYRKDVLRVYDQLRALAYEPDSFIRSGIDCANTRRMAYEHLHGHLEDNPTDVFQIMWILINAVRKKDVPFFKEFARTFELMTNNDAAPETLFTPPADREFYWLGELRKFYEAKSNVLCPSFFSESANKNLSLPQAERPPLTLNQIGDFLMIHLGYRPSDSSISAKAKKVGLPLNKRFGKK